MYPYFDRITRRVMYGRKASSAPVRALLRESAMRSPHVAPFSQGLFYVATGLWPIIHLRSFERVTGPKVDKWLVRTFGALISAVGAALIAGAFEPKPSRAITILGIGSAVALGAADLIYAARGRISKVYLGDAAAEGAIASTWALTRN
jgi:hypothetical protein